MDRSEQLIVALDVERYDDAARLVETLAPHLRWFKIGSKMFTREGPRICAMVKNAGAKLFLDLKFHDIPNTVAGAVESALTLDCDMMTLHASGGPDMIRRAREVVDDANSDAIIVAVTVLTSLGSDELGRLFGSDLAADDMVVSLAAMAREAGAHGVVSSARELPLVKSRVGRDCIVVTPGIRLPDATADDQTRVVTPEAAIADGADYLVVGRPIIAAADPATATEQILTRMMNA